MNSHGGVETDGVRVDHQTPVTSSLESDGTVVTMFQHFSADWYLSWLVNNGPGVGTSLCNSGPLRLRLARRLTVMFSVGSGGELRWPCGGVTGRRERQDWGPGRVSRVETTHDPGLTQ